MATTVARCAFASLALSAKLHKLLDSLQAGHGAAQEAVFDSDLERALDRIDKEHPALHEETRTYELELLKQEVIALERLFSEFRDKERLAPNAADRLEGVFADIREKIKEKEKAF